MTENVVVDYMHDLLEGVCQYDLGKILHYFITKKNPYFSIDSFNSLKDGFVYIYHDKQNKPPSLTETHLKNKNYTMSASEMLSLVRNLPMVIGNLLPEDCERWELIILMNQIIYCVTEKYCHRSAHDYLETIITEYLTLLQKLFPASFKPKHHFLVHYGRVMRTIGPLSHVGCMNFERKHKSGKTTATSSLSRVNVLYTIAFKEQLMLNYQLIQPHSYPEFETGRIKTLDISKLNDYLLFQGLLNNEISLNKISITQSISFDNNMLTSGSILMIPSEDILYFYSIYHLIISNTDKVIAIAKKYRIHTMNTFWPMK